VATIDNGRRTEHSRVKNWAEISSARLAENFHATRSAAGSDVETLAVIKADAYGHNATLCAPILTKAGARWLGVTDVEEGAAVRTALGEGATRMLVMSGMEVSDAAALIAHGLVPVVWTVEQVAAMERAAKAAGQRTTVHVEVDTGMSRQGATMGEPLRKVLAKLATSRWVSCDGVMTHLCCSEVAGAKTTALAQQRFGEALADVAAMGLKPELVHIGNTSAVDEGSTLEWVRQQAKKLQARAMVRTGLALYGYCLPIEAPEETAGRLRPEVKPVMTWKARVLDVREVEAGATVGYGATFVAEKAMRLALIPAGYADGFRREASSSVGNGWVMVNGQRAAVMGRVSMNLTVVDVSAIEGVAPGTEAVLLGEGVSAEDHAAWAGTISYEILCGIRGTHVLR
jgi:alanine racemase